MNQTNIAEHFEEVSEYIEKALDGGGKILVNCQLGLSRAPACVLSYLILTHGMSLAQAVAQAGSASQ